jgi:hypothetical protein
VKQWEFGKDMIIMFIDFENAYDSIKQDMIS